MGLKYVSKTKAQCSSLHVMVVTETARDLLQKLGTNYTLCTISAPQAAVGN